MQIELIVSDALTERELMSKKVARRENLGYHFKEIFDKFGEISFNVEVNVTQDPIEQLELEIE